MGLGRRVGSGIGKAARVPSPRLHTTRPCAPYPPTAPEPSSPEARTASCRTARASGAAPPASRWLRQPRRLAASPPPTATAPAARWRGPSNYRRRCWLGRASRPQPGARGCTRCTTRPGPSGPQAWAWVAPCSRRRSGSRDGPMAPGGARGAAAGSVRARMGVRQGQPNPRSSPNPQTQPNLTTAPSHSGGCGEERLALSLRRPTL